MEEPVLLLTPYRIPLWYLMDFLGILQPFPMGKVSVRMLGCTSISTFRRREEC